MEANGRQRIDWIDVVKAIAIILVIVGHTKCPKAVTRLIFSFHMPLFFVLSGMTFSPAKDWRSLPGKTWRSFRGLILPIVVVLVLQYACNLIAANAFTPAAYWASLKSLFTNTLFWASGVAKDDIAVLGIFWFVFSLFWGKLIINLFSLIFGEKSVPYLCTATAVWAVCLGADAYLPQNLDVTLVAVLFIAAGMVAREHREWIARNRLWLFAISVALWAWGYSQSATVQMAARRYHEGMLSILTALAGSFAMCCIGEALSGNAVVRRALAFVGRHTLIMLILHHLFWAYSDLWAAPTALGMQLKRVGLNLLLTTAIALALAGLRRLARKLPRRKARAE